MCSCWDLIPVVHHFEPDARQVRCTSKEGGAREVDWSTMQQRLTAQQWTTFWVLVLVIQWMAWKLFPSEADHKQCLGLATSELRILQGRKCHTFAWCVP